jgi:cell wall-associated NlpC family hydrolase
MSEPSLGAHLFASRGIYTHHGIYIGDDQVIYYSGLLMD